MKTQYRDPDGLLNCISNVSHDTAQFRMLVNASEEFDPSMIRRSSFITDAQRKMLLDRASKPLELKSQARVYFRRLFGRELPAFVPTLFIPIVLKSYLLYEHN